MGNVLVLPTRYQPTVVERLVSRSVIAREWGVHPKTVDRWVSRDGMPQETESEWGCWVQGPFQRRYYPERVRVWLSR